MSRAGWLAPAFLALALAGEATAAPAARWQRVVPVAQPGKVQVRLDGQAARAAGSHALLVQAPDGGSVPFSVDSGEAAERPGQVVAVTPGASGWQVIVDLGPAPPPHLRLSFRPARLTAAEITLEAGHDLRTWRELARAELYRLGDQERFNRFTLEYPATDERYLRLWWPRAAELPALEDVAVTTAGEAPREQPVEPRCAALPGGQALDCEVRLEDGCRQLHVALAPRAEPLGLRVWRAEDGRWEQRLETARGRHAALRWPAEDGDWRFRLDSPVLPTVASAGCTVAGRILRFEAETPGEYRLWYGGLPRGVSRGSAADEEAPAWVAAGPELAGSWPAWPDLARSAAPLPNAAFAATWPVLAPEADAESVVRLVLSDEVRKTARQDLADLRLEVRGAQLPFVVVRLDHPRILRSGREVPKALDQARSGFTWTFASQLAPPLGPRELSLIAPGSFERRIKVDAVLPPAAPGGNERRSALWPHVGWDCPRLDALPCELRSSAPAAAGTLEVALDDGDDRPLPWIDVELTDAESALLFVWPGAGREVWLHAGAALAAPRYDLVQHRDLLEARPALAAALGPRRGAEAGQPGLPPWVLPLVVGLVALILVTLLVRMIKSTSP